MAPKIFHISICSMTLTHYFLKWKKTTFLNVFAVYQVKRGKLVIYLMKKATMIQIRKLITVVLLTYLTTQLNSIHFVTILIIYFFISTFLIKLIFIPLLTEPSAKGVISGKIKLSKNKQTFNLNNWTVSQTLFWVGYIYPFAKVHSC